MAVYTVHMYRHRTDVTILSSGCDYKVRVVLDVSDVNIGPEWTSLICSPAAYSGELRGEERQEGTDNKARTEPG